MEWEFTDSGNVIHEATTVNDNFIHVVHNLPVSDTSCVGASDQRLGLSQRRACGLFD